MHRRIMILLVLASVLVVTVHSDALRCYMCTSLIDVGCNSSWPAMNSLEPTECTIPKLTNWQRTLAQHRTLSSFATLFEIDDSLNAYPHQTPMTCVKMVFHILNQEVTVRTCQVAKTETIDPCKTTERKMQNNQMGKLECLLCATDACNGATVLSPEIFYTLLSFFGALIHVAFYHWA